jgi:hypothetical protein
VLLFFWGQRTHFKIAKNRCFCEVEFHEVSGQFHIVYVRKSIVEWSAPRAAVNTQKTVRSCLPKSKIGASAVVETKPPMRPIACLRVSRCFALDFTFPGILRITRYRRCDSNESEQDYEAFHDRNLASEAGERKTCLINAQSLTMSALSNCFCAHFCRHSAERVCLQYSFT